MEPFIPPQTVAPANVGLTRQPTGASRRDHLDLSDRLDEDGRRLLEACHDGSLRGALSAPSTVHASAVDSDGLGCSATMSAGYGSGVMPPGTGIWMNNCIGELELNRRGLVAGPPGTPMPSNMAPSVARRDNGALLAIGSPGADRITSALLQVLVNHVQLGMPLRDAVLQPRAHVELTGDGYRVAHEAGVAVEELDVPVRAFEGMSMFFGGVGAVRWGPESGFLVAADPRRSGGTETGGR